MLLPWLLNTYDKHKNNGLLLTSTNLRLFHQYVCKLSHVHITHDSMMLSSAGHTVNPHTIAKAFNQYFQSQQLLSSVSTSFLPSFSLPSPESPPRAFITLSAFPISLLCTIATITKSLPQSSPGVDGIRAILFRKLSNPLSLSLLTLINSCLLHSSLPTPFTVNMIHPHNKQSGPRNSLISYCLLAYTVVLAKIFEYHL